MERLTEKGDKLGSYYIYKSDSDVAFTSVQFDLHTNKVYNKLGQLEDLEEEIGCPLDLIGKLRKANYIYRDDGLEFGFIGINFNDEDKLILYNDDECNIFTSDIKLADYKKKFWLRKDKSE